MHAQQYALALAALLPYVSAHGVITCIYGANGVTMPGLTVVDGTPRDCTTPDCGAQSDTAIYRGTNPLGMLLSGKNVDPSINFKMFMFGNDTDTFNGDDNGAPDSNNASGSENPAENGNSDDPAGIKTPYGTKETMVRDTAGDGKSSGLPTPDRYGLVTLSVHQVNGDGAGPFTAFIDSTSGGLTAAAFKTAPVVQNVAGVASNSATTTTDFPMMVQVPKGTVCSGTIAGVNNVCILKITNAAANGPFGGSVAFTQSSKQRKRAVDYNRMIKRSRIAARAVYADEE
ncbi:hypothetical protein ANO11243_003470 [Dothideomycetidae sp. 11243]|nr:hypothetical protein ANO11243_003470 [fungal sp. No.11243]